MSYNTISLLTFTYYNVKQSRLDSFDLNKLKLWKVYIPISENENKLNILNKQPQEVDIK